MEKREDREMTERKGEREKERGDLIFRMQASVSHVHMIEHTI